MIRNQKEKVVRLLVLPEENPVLYNVEIKFYARKCIWTNKEYNTAFLMAVINHRKTHKSEKKMISRQSYIFT